VWIFNYRTQDVERSIQFTSEEWFEHELASSVHDWSRVWIIHSNRLTAVLPFCWNFWQICWTFKVLWVCWIFLSEILVEKFVEILAPFIWQHHNRRSRVIGDFSRNFVAVAIKVGPTTFCMVSLNWNVRPSVCLSIKRRYCIETKKASVMISSPSKSQNILVSRNIWFITKFKRGHPERGRFMRRVGKNWQFWRFFDQ